MIDQVLKILVLWVFSLILHSIFHRFTRRIKKKTLLPATVYGGGLIVTYMLYGSFVGTTLYLLLSTLTFILYLGPFLGSVAPAAIILDFFNNHSPVQKKDILSAFSEHELVDKRLDDLHDAGYIQDINKRYVLTRKGKGIYTILKLYQSVSGWAIGG